MESAHPTILSNETCQQRNAISYIKSVAKMNTDDLTDMLDGINSSDLSRHTTTIKNWKKNDDYNTSCDALITLNNKTYAHRYHYDEHYTRQLLLDLRTACKQLVDSL